MERSLNRRWEWAPRSWRTAAAVLTPALLGVAWAGVSAQERRVRVVVSEAAVEGGASYSYRVYNGSSQPIVGLTIGRNPRTDESELRTTPLGWTPEQGLPASSASAPRGWTTRVVTTEESDLVEIAWSSDGGPQGDIAPGATMTGFSVTLLTPSAEYSSAGFLVVLGNGTRVSGRVGPD